MFNQTNHIKVSPRRFIPRAIFWPLFFITILSLAAFTFWYYDRYIWHNSLANYLPADTNWFVTMPSKPTNAQMEEISKVLERVPNHEDLLNFDFIKSLGVDAKFINLYEVWQRRADHLGDKISLTSLPEGHALLARIINKDGIITETEGDKVHSARVGDYLVISDSKEALSRIINTKENQRHVITGNLRLRKAGRSLFDTSQYKDVSLDFGRSLVSGYIYSDIESLPVKIPVKDSVFFKTLQEYIPDFSKKSLKDLLGSRSLPVSFMARAENSGLVIRSRRFDAGNDDGSLDRYFASSDTLRSLSIRDTSDVSQAVTTLLQVLPGWRVKKENYHNVTSDEVFISVKQVDAQKLAQAGKILSRLEKDGHKVAGEDSFAVEAAARLADTVIIQNAIAQFQSVQGRAPAALEELVPLYLSAVPIDPGLQTRYNYNNEGTDKIFWTSFVFETETRLGPPGLYCLTSQGIEFRETECIER